MRYFIIHNLAQDQPEVVRFAALLRGTESAWQALSYGLGSLAVFGEVGGIYLNLGLWAVSIYPAWLVLRHFGASKSPSDETDDGKTAPARDSPDASSVEEVQHVNFTSKVAV